jgi:hypothetical protein
VYVCMYVCMYVYVWKCMYGSVYACMHVCTYARIHVQYSVLYDRMAVCVMCSSVHGSRWWIVVRRAWGPRGSHVNGRGSSNEKGKVTSMECFPGRLGLF